MEDKKHEQCHKDHRDFLINVIKGNDQIIARMDSKTGFLLAGNGIIFSGLMFLVVTDNHTFILNILLFTLMLLFAFNIVFALAIIAPQNSGNTYKKRKDNTLKKYYESIFYKDWARFDFEEVCVIFPELESFVKSAITTAIIATWRTRTVKLLKWFSILSVALSIVVICTYIVGLYK